MALRNWGWFVIIQKTKPLIGRVNLEDELRLLEERANNTWGKYKDQLDTKVSVNNRCFILAINNHYILQNIVVIYFISVCISL